MSAIRRTRPAPLAGRLVVAPCDHEVATSSGLVSPDTAHDRPIRGTVLAVGSGKRSETTGESIPVDISPGVTVVDGQYAGTEITIDGQDLLILSAGEMPAITGDAPQS